MIVSNEIPDDEDLLDLVRKNPGITTSAIHRVFPQMARQTIYNRMRRYRKHELVRSNSTATARSYTAGWYAIE